LGQAAVKRFFNATFLERKIMSTKTSFKRIALVAASALAIAGFSAVPSNAASVIGTVSVADQTVTCFVGDTCKALVSVTTTAAGAATASADDVVTLTTASVTAVTGATAIAKTTDVAENGAATASTKFALRAAGAGASLATTASAVYVPSIVSNKLTLTPANAAAAGTYSSGQFEFVPNTPGSYTFSITPSFGAAGATAVAGTITVNVVSLGGKIGDGGAVASPFTAVNGVAGAFNYVTLQANGMARTSGALGTQIVVSGSTVISASAGTVSTDKKQIVIDGVTHATNPGTASTITIATPTTGTITVSSYIETAAGLYSSTPNSTVTITVAAAVVSGVYAKSLAYMNTSTTTPDATSDAATAATAPLASASASNTPLANIKVSQVDAQATPVNVATASTKAIVYEISGAGALGTANNARLGSYIAVAAGSANDNIVYIFPDGREGTGTVTVTVNGVLVSTKKVSFYGAPAKYTATTQYIASANGVTSTDAVVVCAADKNGIAVPSATILATSGATTVATVTGSATTAASAVVTSGTIPTSYVAAKAIGCAGFNVTGASQTTADSVTITFADAATSPTVTTTAVVKVGSVAATTVALTSDAATYTAGSKITLTLTFKDSVGRLVAGGVGTGTLAAALASSSSLNGDALFATANATKLGVATAVVYAPLSGGPLSITGTTGANATYLVTAAQGLSLALDLSVEGDATASLALDAANAATDAANNAYDEAQNATQAASDALAAVTALAKQVKSLIASVKALTAAVAKLKK
jgi:hypothetical protein